MPKQPCVYILTNRRNGTLYVGVTSNLARRIWEHRNHIECEFTTRYALTRLVWYEPYDTMEGAIRREKQIKKWNRDWKINRIIEMNPDWRDLYEDLA